MRSKNQEALLEKMYSNKFMGCIMVKSISSKNLKRNGYKVVEIPYLGEDERLTFEEYRQLPKDMYIKSRLRRDILNYLNACHEAIESKEPTAIIVDNFDKYSCVEMINIFFEFYNSKKEEKCSMISPFLLILKIDNLFDIPENRDIALSILDKVDLDFTLICD